MVFRHGVVVHLSFDEASEELAGGLIDSINLVGVRELFSHFTPLDEAHLEVVGVINSTSNLTNFIKHHPLDVCNFDV